ncbi:MAG: hypothetical protein H0U87_05675 [Acidobacteria bacterium]|jgi:hypothetical protein|nr:hypothetical protein [Acidobacteriota bacterium]
MSEKTITITERDGAYEIQNNGMSEFALIGILECVLFDMKTARSEKPIDEKESAASAETNEIAQKPEESKAEPKKKRDDKPDNTPDEMPQPKVAPPSSSPELRTRIANAVKAIKALGGEVDETGDRLGATEEELKTELEELTEQYKRLKKSGSAKK